MISGHSGRGRPEQSEVAGPVHVVQEGLRQEILQCWGVCPLPSCITRSSFPGLAKLQFPGEPVK